jgi:rsbT antagonist protein RsbS
MDRIPIIKIGDILLVSVQIDMYDQLALDLEKDLIQMVDKYESKGVLIDISAVFMVDSFMGRILGNIAAMSKVMDAISIVVGMQPAVAITLVELGMPLHGIHTALNVEKGMELLQRQVTSNRETETEADDDEHLE